MQLNKVSLMLIAKKTALDVLFKLEVLIVQLRGVAECKMNE